MACPDIFGGLRSCQKRSSEVAFVRFFEQKTIKKHNRDEYFGGKRNDANGTLWTDTKLNVVPIFFVVILPVFLHF